MKLYQRLISVTGAVSWAILRRSAARRATRRNKVTFTGSAGLKVDLAYRQNFTKSYAWIPVGCPVDRPRSGSA